MIPGSSAHPPAAASVVSVTAANMGPRPHPTGDPLDTLLLACCMSSWYLSNSAGGVICPPKHFGCAGECDEGLFSVSGKMVQFADTFDSSMHIHVNGLWHIPAKACTPSSNLHHLAGIIPRMKFDTGSHQSRTNKNSYLGLHIITLILT